MKIKSILALTMAAAVFALASCDKNDDNTPAGGEKYTLGIKLPSNVKAETRSVGAPETGGTGAKTLVNSVDVFLLVGDNVIQRESFDATDMQNGKKDITNVSRNITNVLVVANIPAANLAAVQALTSGNAVRNYAYTIASQQGALINSANSEIVHMGEATSVDFQTGTPINPGSDYKTVTVNLTSRVARFQYAGGLTAGEGIATLALEAVAFDNYFADGAATATTVNNATTAYWDLTGTATALASSSDLAGVSGFQNAYAVPAYRDLYDATVDGTAFVYAYNLFTGSYVPHMYLLLSGEYATGYYKDSDKYFLAWVRVNKFTATTDIDKVESNKIYKIGALTVKYTDLLEHPDDAKLDLGVEVEMADWTDVNVTPGIQ